MFELQWVEVTKKDLREASDDEVSRLYNDMCCDQGREYSCDSCGNMVLITREQKKLIGNYFRGRGLAKR